MNTNSTKHKQPKHYEAVVIGTGFGGTMTGLSLGREFFLRGKGEKVLLLERGTWWTTPVSTVQDKDVQTAKFLMFKRQPVQYWPAVNHFKGVIDLLSRCIRRRGNEDGLYELTTFGAKRRFLGLDLGVDPKDNDGVTVLRSSGVGGGSLVYSNVTIQPPNFIFEDPRWPTTWDSQERSEYYELARNAIGFGVVYARVLDEHAEEFINPAKSKSARRAELVDRRRAILNRDFPKGPQAEPVQQLNAARVNTGLSNIVTRSARLNPKFVTKLDSSTKREVKRLNVKDLLDPGKSPYSPGKDQLPPIKPIQELTPQNDLSPGFAFWIDRARVFQTAMSDITGDFGTVDSSINDLLPEPNPLGFTEGKNFCERQGRCIVGCLPGARHTLNKQLMAAIFGGFKAKDWDKSKGYYGENMEIKALAEVRLIRERKDGKRGYEIEYWQRDQNRPKKYKSVTVTADRVILAAGCISSNELMLRCQRENTLPNLSQCLGEGFSTNGDYLAFLEDTKEKISLTRGPVTTSFGHFHTPDSVHSSYIQRPDPEKFHTIEDNGVPPVGSSLVSVTIPLLRSLTSGRRLSLKIIWGLLKWLTKFIRDAIRAPFANAQTRQKLFQSEDEFTDNWMCIAAMGRDAADGKFTLGGANETVLRVERTDRKKFHDDPIYDEIRKTLRELSGRLRDKESKKESKKEFINPFFELNKGGLNVLASPVALSHPLGGCRMAKSPDEGVVDEFGRVFNADKKKRGDDRPFYEGLYIADAAIIPTALGVNPSLTISALALRVADKIIEELDVIQTQDG